MSRARELARLGNANAISIDSSNNVGFGTTTSIQYKLDVVGDANFTGVLTATSFGGDGSNLTGVAATDNINTNNIKVSGISTLGTASATTLTATTSTVVGSAVTFNASGGTIVGVLTATSFEGDGSSLTGVAATDYIVSNSLKVLGISTFSGEVTAAGGVDVTGGVKSAGIVTFTNTTASTSSSTGALVVSGGVGIAGSLHVGENVSVGGTITYEDVTNIDSVGVVTARLGVVATAGRGVEITAGGLNVAAGIATFGGGDIQISGSAAGVSSVTWDASANSLIFKDSSVAAFGDDTDLQIYHQDSINYIKSTNASAPIQLQAPAGEVLGKFTPNGSVDLYHNGNRKLITMSTGVAVVGLLSATTLSGNGSAITNLPAASISTTASTAAGIVSTLALGSAQDHKVTVSGISTFTCSGGSEGDSHTLRITNSGITTIGFSTYFLFPSGSAPSIPTADGTVSLISFTVHRVGTPGIATQLLAGASLNFS